MKLLYSNGTYYFQTKMKRKSLCRGCASSRVHILGFILLILVVITPPNRPTSQTKSECCIRLENLEQLTERGYART